jgi:hypothetical protein
VTFNLVDTQEAIKAYLDTNLAFDVFTGGIEEATNLLATNGVLRPHVVLRFGSAQPRLADQSFGGARYDGQDSTLDAMCVAAYDLHARQLASKVADVLIGYRPDSNSGELKLDWGGGSFTVISEGSRPQFYISWVSIRFPTNLANVGA